MTASKEIKEMMYWLSDPSWYRINEETDDFELTDNAPERAKRSFDMWKKPKKYGISR